MDFVDFFQKATASDDTPTGRRPYPYQIAFAQADRLPELLNIPTGVGKTATAALGWLYRRRFHPDKPLRKATPRRLVYCLPMRTLVEQTQREVQRWVANLGLRGKIGVHLLMGGQSDDDWDGQPERDAILIGTQDMLLSRALNRGYGMSRYRWPMHFALLNNDCLWVIDETQLMGVGLTTTAQLQGLRAKLKTYGTVHSLWMSATLDTAPLSTVDHRGTDMSRLVLSEADRQHEPVRRRLGAKKSLKKSPIELNAQSSKKNYAQDLAAAVCTAHRGGTLTLVVLNRVGRAQAVFAELKKLASAKDSALDAQLSLIHARFRPCDRQAHEKVLFSQEPAQAGRIVVATQAIEAGVDVSAATLFTELAPWSSLVQRFGRCNRAGEFSDAQVYWIDIEPKNDKDDVVPPYDAAELASGRELLARLSDVGPASLESIRDKRPAPVVHTLRRKDLLDLWDTTPDLAGNDLDISRFIRDSNDTDVQFYWREFSGDAPDDADFAKPVRHELCSVAVGRARDFLKKLKKNHLRALLWNPLDEKWRKIEPEEARPGMVLLLATGWGGYDDGDGKENHGVGWTGNPADKPRPHPPESGNPQDRMNDGANLYASDWVSLADHLQRVVQAAEELQASAKDWDGEIPWPAIITAARWHDVGKAHPAFQNMLFHGRNGEVDERRGALWAKSGDRRGGRPRYFADAEEKDERIGFRHELASALAWLAHGDDGPDANLIAFLIAAHHGKVRGSIRSLPNERPSSDPMQKFARGVRDGDPLPAVQLGDGEMFPGSEIDLQLMELGSNEAGPSWLTRTLQLREAFGPFRLSFLETLLRVADWRGSDLSAGESAP